MKRRYIAWALSGVGVCLVSTAFAVSLANPGFESGTLNEPAGTHLDVDQINNWTLWCNGGEDGDYYDTSESTGYAVHGGNRAWRQWDNEGWAVFQDVSGIQAGASYNASIWVFSGNASGGDTFGNDGGTDRDAAIRIIWDDDGNFWDAGTTDDGFVDRFDPDEDPATTWVQLWATVTAPANANYVRFELKFTEDVGWLDGSISFDDAYFGEAIPEPSTLSLLGVGAFALRNRLRRRRRKGI